MKRVCYIILFLAFSLPLSGNGARHIGILENFSSIPVKRQCCVLIDENGSLSLSHLQAPLSEILKKIPLQDSRPGVSSVFWKRCRYLTADSAAPGVFHSSFSFFLIWLKLGILCWWCPFIKMGKEVKSNLLNWHWIWVTIQVQLSKVKKDFLYVKRPWLQSLLNMYCGNRPKQFFLLRREYPVLSNKQF